MKSVKYQFDIIDISGHLIEITLQFNPTGRTHQLSLPAWIPGSYMIRDFARNIVAINAEDGDGPLPLQQQDKQCWQLSCNGKAVTVRYQIYAYDLSVRAAYIDDALAILNPACLCLAVDTQQHLVHSITVNKPKHAECRDWRVATALDCSGNTKMLGFGRYQAADYATLIDSPVMLGRFTVNEFSVNDVPHYLVVSGDNLADLQRFCDDVQRICQQQVNVFGALPDDLQQYWFLLWVTEEGYGGLEHNNSTLLLCNRFDLPAPTLKQPDDNYQNLLALCSHEYFHTWWVKRLKPACFHSYQLAAEQYTPQLWLYEGFTSYFDDLALVRAGVIEAKTYLSTLEKTISRVTRNPSDRQQSLTDSSFTAWTKFYKQDENAANAVVSYYAKGALLALCLDAELRQAGSSLEHVIRQLWQRYLPTGTADDALAVVLQDMGFTELATLSDTWINTAAPLPLAKLLSGVGLKLMLRPMQHGDDLGGEAGSTARCFIGAQTKLNNGLLQLSQVYHGGNAHQAGLMVGDQLLAIDGRKVTPNSLPQLLTRYVGGTEVTLHFYRKDRLLQSSLIISDAVQQVAMLSVADEALNQQWLFNR